MSSFRSVRRVAIAATLAASGVLAMGSSPATAVTITGVKGIDVSHYNTVNWANQYANGKRFAYVKATEGSTFQDPMFASHYNGSYNAGFIRGAYHFAQPGTSSAAAATQADYFVNHGGGWSADGKTLPGALDLEGGCYGRSQADMVTWITNFANRYKYRTGRDVVLYTTTSWWKTCTGNTAKFASTNPLWIARYNGASTPGELPAGWNYDTFWQYSSTPIDQDRFNGDMTGLRRMALG